MLELAVEPLLYKAFPARDLIAARKARAEESFAVVEQSLEQFECSANDRENIWNIAGREAMLQKAMECISAAPKRILLEIWVENFPLVEAALKNAADHGVFIIIISYGEINVDFAEVYRHDMSVEITTEYGGSWIVFSADDSHVVAGAVSLDAESQAAWHSIKDWSCPLRRL